MRGSCAFFLVALLLATVPARAEEVSSEEPYLQVSLWRAWLVRDGETAQAHWGGMAYGAQPLGQRVRLVGRFEATAGAELELTEPETWESVEYVGGVTVQAWDRLRLAVLAGRSTPLGAEAPSSGLIAGVGASLPIGEHGWVYALLGVHRATGEGARLMVGALIPVSGPAAIKLDVVRGGERGYVIVGAAAGWGK